MDRQLPSMAVILALLIGCAPFAKPVVTATKVAIVDPNAPITQTYDVTDLVAGFDDTASPGLSRPMRQTDRDLRLAQLRLLLIIAVDPASWRDNGGNIGSISVPKTKDRLIVTQTPENQLAVCPTLLRFRREQLKAKPRDVAPLPSFTISPHTVRHVFI